MSALEEKVETTYQAGDMVLIRQDLEVGERYKMNTNDESNTFNYYMQNVRISKVERVLGDSSGYNLDSVGYIWTDEMFEGKIEPINFWTDFEITQGEEVVITTDNTSIKDEFLGLVVKFSLIDRATGLVKVDFEDTNFAYFDKKDILGKLLRPTTEAKVETTEEIVDKKEKPEVVDFKDTYIPFNIKIERVIFNNPATIVFYKTVNRNEDGYYEDNGKIKKVVSKVQDGDVYEKATGLDLCLLKAFNRESAKMIKELSK